MINYDFIIFQLNNNTKILWIIRFQHAIFIKGGFSTVQIIFEIIKGSCICLKVIRIS